MLPVRQEDKNSQPFAFAFLLEVDPVAALKFGHR